jgi:hypothetical protein
VLKSSKAISRVNVELKTQLSEISSVSIIRVDVTSGHALLIRSRLVIEVSSFKRTPQNGFLPHSYLRTDTYPVFETLWSLEYRPMDKVRKPSNPECYISSSEPFRIYLIIMLSSLPQTQLFCHSVVFVFQISFNSFTSYIFHIIFTNFSRNLQPFVATSLM